MKTVVLDLDGTMYRGSQIIQSAKEFIDYCLENKIPFIFLTNNAMRTRAQNVKHMLDMGYSGISSEQFFNSAMAACAYAKKQYSIKRAVYLGKDGLKEAMELSSIEYDPKHPQAVFVGLNKEATYQEYSQYLAYLLKGAKLIGTNKDRILASPKGFEIGNGSIVKMFEYASNQISPDIGKPATAILDLCLDHFELDRNDILLVGDNLETDIKLGQNANIETVFVQTGVHTKEDIKRLNIHPTYVIDHLMELPALIFDHNNDTI